MLPLAIVLLVVVGYLALQAPAATPKESLPPADGTNHLGISIPSPATAALPTASKQFQNTLEARYQLVGDAAPKPGAGGAGFIRKASAAESANPSAQLPDGGKELVTTKPATPVTLTRVPPPATNRIKL